MQRPTPLIQYPGGTGKTEAKAGKSLGSRPAWSTQIITHQLGYTVKTCLIKKALDLGVAQWSSTSLG